MLHGSRPRTICTPVVAILTVGLCMPRCARMCVWVQTCGCMFFLSFFLSRLIHHCLTGHVDPSCCGSQVTMAPACDTAGCVWLVYPAAFCQVIFNIRAVEWHQGASTAIFKPSQAHTVKDVHLCQSFSLTLSLEIFFKFTSLPGW